MSRGACPPFSTRSPQRRGPFAIGAGLSESPARMRIPRESLKGAGRSPKARTFFIFDRTSVLQPAKLRTKLRRSCDFKNLNIPRESSEDVEVAMHFGGPLPAALRVQRFHRITTTEEGRPSGPRVATKRLTPIRADGPGGFVPSASSARIIIAGIGAIRALFLNAENAEDAKTSRESPRPSCPLRF